MGRIRHRPARRGGRVRRLSAETQTNGPTVSIILFRRIATQSHTDSAALVGEVKQTRISTGSARSLCQAGATFLMNLFARIPKPTTMVPNMPDSSFTRATMVESFAICVRA